MSIARPQPLPALAPMDRDTLLAAEVTQPRAGQLLAMVPVRRPYQTEVSLALVDTRPMRETLLSRPISHRLENTASTSLVEGLSSRLAAMARAVRSRSYVAIAKSHSRIGALLNFIAAKRRSKSSVMSMDSPSSLDQKSHRNAARAA
jgi:hypothetical protein